MTSTLLFSTLLLGPLFWFWIIAWSCGVVLFFALAFGFADRFRRGPDRNLRDLEDDSRFHGQRPLRE